LGFWEQNRLLGVPEFWNARFPFLEKSFQTIKKSCETVSDSFLILKNLRNNQNRIPAGTL